MRCPLEILRNEHQRQRSTLAEEHAEAVGAALRAAASAPGGRDLRAWPAQQEGALHCSTASLALAEYELLVLGSTRKARKVRLQDLRTSVCGVASELIELSTTSTAHVAQLSEVNTKGAALGHDAERLNSDTTCKRADLMQCWADYADLLTTVVARNVAKLQRGARSGSCRTCQSTRPHGHWAESTTKDHKKPGRPVPLEAQKDGPLVCPCRTRRRPSCERTSR